MYNPPVLLPPDLKFSEVETFVVPTELWHRPKAIYEPIWSRYRGEGITVAVLDTGCNPHDVLPDPVEGKSFIQGESWKDGNGHGTHCAGTVLGREGIGVAPAASLLVGKVLSNRGGGSSEAIAQGIRWAVDAGAHIISLSLGSSSPYKPMQEALQYAWAKGVIVVAAAGNSGYTGRANTIGYPARYHSECLAIGAYRKDGNRASFSSGGRELDVLSPGEDIISCSTNNSYTTMSGTSMATPNFAGLCALIQGIRLREGYAVFDGIEGVRDFLKLYTKDVGEPGFDPAHGHGIPQTSEIINALLNDQLVYV